MKELLKKEDFEELLNDKKPALIDFYADWCGPCQALLPTLEILSETHQDQFNIVKVNVDDNKELAAAFKVRSIPAMFFIKNKTVVESLTGNHPMSVLEKKILNHIETK